MLDNHDFRFDDIQRTERYFSATLLPALLMHDNFRGLQVFLNRVFAEVPRPRGADGHTQPVNSAPLSLDPQHVELITEFHIARDLEAAGKLQAPLNSPDDIEPASPEDPVRRNVPDIVIVVGNQLVVCEAKFFSSFNLASLNAQLQSQRESIKTLFRTRSSLSGYRHVALLPEPMRGRVDCDLVVTWAELALMAREVLGPDHYVTQRIFAGVKYYEGPSDQPLDTTGVDGQESLEAILRQCRQGGAQIWVGFTGGATAIANASLSYLVGRSWKWRTSLNGAHRPNWIACADFVSLMENRLRGQQVTVSRTAEPYCDAGLSLEDILHRCRTNDEDGYVGYIRGRTDFARAPLHQIRGQKRWRWHAKGRHRPIHNSDRWVPAPIFLARLEKLNADDNKTA